MPAPVLAAAAAAVKPSPIDLSLFTPAECAAFEARVHCDLDPSGAAGVMLHAVIPGANAHSGTFNCQWTYYTTSPSPPKLQKHALLAALLAAPSLTFDGKPFLGVHAQFSTVTQQKARHAEVPSAPQYHTAPYSDTTHHLPSLPHPPDLVWQWV